MTDLSAMLPDPPDGFPLPAYTGTSQTAAIAASLLEDDRFHQRSDLEDRSVLLILKLGDDDSYRRGHIYLRLSHSPIRHHTVIAAETGDPYQANRVAAIITDVLFRNAGWNVARIDDDSLAVGSPDVPDWIEARRKFRRELIATVPGQQDVDLDDLLPDGHIRADIFDDYPGLAEWIYRIGVGDIEVPAAPRHEGALG